MSYMTPEEAVDAANDWRRRHEQLKAERDPLIRALLEAGMSKLQICGRMGISRDTVYRVLAAGAA